MQLRVEEWGNASGKSAQSNTKKVKSPHPFKFRVIGSCIYCWVKNRFCVYVLLLTQ